MINDERKSEKGRNDVLRLLVKANSSEGSKVALDEDALCKC